MSKPVICRGLNLEPWLPYCRFSIVSWNWFLTSTIVSATVKWIDQPGSGLTSQAFFSGVSSGFLHVSTCFCFKNGDWLFHWPRFFSGVVFVVWTTFLQMLARFFLQYLGLIYNACEIALFSVVIDMLFDVLLRNLCNNYFCCCFCSKNAGINFYH